MKKITAVTFVFSVVFYLLFYFVLFDAPSVISSISFFVCTVLSVVNLINSIVLLQKNRRLNIRSSSLLTSAFTVNLVIFLLILVYILAAYLLPYQISVG